LQAKSKREEVFSEINSMVGRVSRLDPARTDYCEGKKEEETQDHNNKGGLVKRGGRGQIAGTGLFMVI